MTMKRFSPSFTLIPLLVLALPGLAFALGHAAAATAAGDAGDIGGHIGHVIDAVRSGSAIAIAAALVMLLVDLFKAPWLGSVVKKIPKRWRIAVPIMLGGVAGILSDILGGLPWQEAVLVGLFAGPTAVFAHEAVVEAILGHARTRDAGAVDAGSTAVRHG
ncbi:hypothetical protein [Haliangium sp.]|uniref:hypothetical protein n=1 Tax=Haliangium sp. TaxID=2663208 RepID=UPI003D14C873